MIAAVQLSSQADVGRNLDRVEVLIAEAARRGAAIVLLPENFAYLGGDEASKRAVAEDLGQADGPIARRLSGLARTHGIDILGGGMPERSSDPDRPFNTLAVFRKDGSVHAAYHKIHLFDVDLLERSYRESAAVTAGDEPVVIEAGGLRIGLSICYDLRFPELYRALAARGADVLVVPAAFTVTTGKDHWHVLLRARAIESQAYVVAAAQWGKHPGGRATYGKSCIIDPWGEIIAQASEGEGVITASIDLTYLAHVRESLPSLRHRRLV
ncbi:Aliphatic amidase AmiE [Minicystis rosea]|nr:Aliphatic amidase AmiE [Minicystis rosea]